MIDQRALGEPNNVVVEDERDFDLLKAWAKAGTQNNTQLWMQINHPGKQVPKGLNHESVAPSAIPFGKQMASFFATPRELTQAEIEDIIQRFARTAFIAKKAGFSGVQIHGAHGYLLNQFLSPISNKRTDQYGGSRDNRMRLTLEVFEAIRKVWPEPKPIGVRLSCVEWVEGGWSIEDTVELAKRLKALFRD